MVWHPEFIVLLDTMSYGCHATPQICVTMPQISLATIFRLSFDPSALRN